MAAVPTRIITKPVITKTRGFLRTSRSLPTSKFYTLFEDLCKKAPNLQPQLPLPSIERQFRGNSFTISNSDVYIIIGIDPEPNYLTAEQRVRYD